MSALVIVDIDVTDPVRYEDYKKLATESIAKHGGRYLVRGGASEVLNGNWTPKRLVVLEFKSVDDAKRWQASTDYGEAKKIRDRAARVNMVVVQGL